MDQSYLPSRAGPAPSSPAPSTPVLDDGERAGNAEIQGLLTDHGWLDTVSDEETRQALDGLLALPPDAQRAAVDALDDEAIEDLIDGLPEERQADLMALAAASGDTRRKVRLWSVAQLAEARAAMASDEESPWFFDSSSEAELARHHEDVRDAPLTDTRGATGLMALFRGDCLRELGRRVWSTSELVEVAVALSRLPSEHVGDNLALREIRRMEGPTLGLFVSHGLIGSTTDGRVSIYDEAAVDHAPTSVPAEEDSCPPVNPMPAERTSAHPDAMTDLMAAAGWRKVEDVAAMGDWAEEVSGERPSARALEALEAGRTDPAADHDPVRSGDWTYGYDPYSPTGYVIHASDAIPKDEQAEAMLRAEQAGEIDESCPIGADNWAYARTSPEEHFAELYTKAVHQPESLRSDLVEAPAARVAEAVAAVEEAQRWLSAVPATATDEERAMQRATLEVRQQSLQRAQAAQTSRAEQWAMLQRLLPGLPE